MAHRVLVALDGSEQSVAALDHAVETFPDSTIVVFHALDPFDADPEGESAQPLTDAWHEAERERAGRLFDRAVEAVGVDPDGVERETSVGPPAETIVAFAEENDVDHVVLGSYGRGGASQLHLGSVAEVVVRRAPVPVTVVR